MDEIATQVWMVLGAAFGASILTSIGALGVAAYNGRKTAERDRREDLRRMRDAKRERLREDYVHLVRAGLTMDEVAAELLFVDDEDLSTERWKRLDDALGKAKEDLDRAVVRVSLESEAVAVLETYEEIRQTFRDYGRALSHEQRSPEEPQTSMTLLTRLRSLLDKLKTQARDHLDSLAKPM